MTTDHTDAAVRILTKTIRKLTAQLAEADESISYEADKRREVEDELAAVRSKLNPIKPDMLGGYVVLEWNATPDKTVGQLADERMAELADERKKLHLVKEEAADHRRRVRELYDRIEQALLTISDVPDNWDARRILRGEA